VDCHCSERLIDLMRNRCGHFSKGRHTHNVRELRARLICRFLFSLDLRRKVGRRSDRHYTDRRIRNSGLRWTDVNRQNVTQEYQADATQTDENDAALCAEACRDEHDRRVENRKGDFRLCCCVSYEDSRRKRDRYSRQ
jgi:hypothetical protein